MLLTWFAADPDAIQVEQPKSCAAVMVARSSMCKQFNAEENTNAEAGLDDAGDSGLQKTDQQTGTDAGRIDASVSVGTGLLQQAAPQVETGCVDGSCVAMPATGVRHYYYRKRARSR